MFLFLTAAVVSLIGLISAISLKKGSEVHCFFGKFFFVGSWLILAAQLYLTKFEINEPLAFTLVYFYSVYSGFRAFRLTPNDPLFKFLDLGPALLFIALFIYCLSRVEHTHNAAFYILSLGLFISGYDGITRLTFKREDLIIRHFSRMFIAALCFTLLGLSVTRTYIVVPYEAYLPVALVGIFVSLLIYWHLRQRKVSSSFRFII